MHRQRHSTPWESSEGAAFQVSQPHLRRNRTGKSRAASHRGEECAPAAAWRAHSPALPIAAQTPPPSPRSGNAIPEANSPGATQRPRATPRLPHLLRPRRARRRALPRGRPRHPPHIAATAEGSAEPGRPEGTERGAGHGLTAAARPAPPGGGRTPAGTRRGASPPPGPAPRLPRGSTSDAAFRHSGGSPGARGRTRGELSLWRRSRGGTSPPS